MAGWLYMHLGRTCGPVTGDELNELAEVGDLDSEDMVWREGADPGEAVRAGYVLVFFLAGGKPQPPKAPSGPPRAPAAPPPGPVPTWLAELADARAEGGAASQASASAPVDRLQDVRRAEEASRRGKP